MSAAQRVGYALAAGLVVAQLAPVERTDPPVEAELVAEPEVRALLRRACYDCHSRETVWPWYAWVAPLSWLVAHDVHHGRRELDFSRFESYGATRQQKKLGEVAEEVEEREMPLWYYLLVHPEARLSEAERARLVSWAEAERARRRAPAPPS